MVPVVVGNHLTIFDTQAKYPGAKKKLRGFSPQANYTDRATAACR
jgi:hypothetical protein